MSAFLGQRRLPPLRVVCHLVGVAALYMATVPFFGAVGHVIGTSTLDEPRAA